MKASLIIFGVLILIGGIALFYEALLIYQFVTTPTYQTTLLRNDYLIGGSLFAVIGTALVYLGVK